VLSALHAGYSPSDPAAAAGRLLKNSKVIEALRKLRAKTIAKSELTIEMVLKEYERIGFSDIRDVMEVDSFSVTIKDSKDWTEKAAASIAEVRPTKEGVSLKLHSKVAALDRLYTHLTGAQPPIAISEIYMLRGPGCEPAPKDPDENGNGRDDDSAT